MKKTFLVMVMLGLLSNFAFAQSEGPSTQYIIRYYNSSLCSFWTHTSSPGGTSGYICSSYPSSAMIPDAQSTQSAIDQLEARIKALEAKVGK